MGDSPSNFQLTGRMIYNINKQIDELLEQEIINPETGEVTYSPEGLATLKMQLDDMVVGFIDSMSHEAARLDAIKREQDRLKDLKKSTENKIERAKVCLAMILGAGNKWSNELHKISWRKSEETVIDDEALIPKEFLVEKITYSPNKLKIKGELKAEIKIPGCHLETKNNIQVN